MLALLLSTGGLIFLSPRRAVLVAVPIFINLLGTLPVQFRFEQHYSALLLPFLFWAMTDGWARGQSWLGNGGRWHTLFGYLFFAVAIVVCLTHQKLYYSSFSRAKREALRQLVSLVPVGDSVHATTNLVPRFAARPDVRMFPAPSATRWVALDFSPTGLYVSRNDQEAELAFNHRFQKAIVYSRENLRLYDLARVAKP